VRPAGFLLDHALVRPACLDQSAVLAAVNTKPLRGRLRRVLTAAARDAFSKMQGRDGETALQAEQRNGHEDLSLKRAPSLVLSM